MKLLFQFAQAAALSAALAVCALAQEGTQLNPIKWSLKADLPAKALRGGDKFTVQLTAEIEEGWHLYSTEEMPQGPKPTRIAFAPNQPFELQEIESPAPQKEFDQNFGIETEFYVESVTFTLPAKVKPDAPAGAHKLAVQVRFQTCTESLCLPPKLIKLEVEVPVRDQVGIRFRTPESQKRTPAVTARLALFAQNRIIPPINRPRQAGTIFG
ncbi:MAG TPA: protein-disulfide reductase DsbD N-terminal domain-containing protein [Blastocatellia bacterium]|nr:protein-disulfide reductase DsbD N-terminal domain-containing protein [Blastocatellia bacterium]